MDGAVVCADGIASEEDDEVEECCEESDTVCPATSAPDDPLRVLNSILAGIGVVEGIIKVWVTRIPGVSGSAERICLLGRAEWFSVCGCSLRRGLATDWSGSWACWN